MSQLTLTSDQQAAYDSFVAFITSPTEQIFVLQGYAGTGKSTLVQRFLDDLPATLAAVRLITQKYTDWTILLTATTNKACEALSAVTGQEVKTIQSALELRVQTDYKTRETSLVPRTKNFCLENHVIFIDEASFADKQLLTYIATRTLNCKIIFIGDPAQLAPPKSGHAPVFFQGYKTATLTEVVRQAQGNQIIELATAFRNTVNGQPWSVFIPNVHQVNRLDRADFEKEILAEFARPDWRHAHSKVLAYTNRTVISYNHGIRDHVQGVPELQVGDYAVCNNFIGNKECKVKTDQLVQITHIHPANELGVDGWHVELDHFHHAFLPRSLDDKKARLKKARLEARWAHVETIESAWIDLRAAFACTINKSQGSTYDRVFIDLDDVKSCRNPNNMARLMYVAVSRARHQVLMTGDLV